MKNKKHDGGLRSKLKKENKAVNKSPAGAVTLNMVHLPYAAAAVFAFICLTSIFTGLLSPYSESYMDPSTQMQAPGISHIFGTDTLGRDMFSMILYGGRVSIYIGLLATLISTFIAILYGCTAGLAGERTDDLMMRSVEMLLSIPSILLVIFLQAAWGEATPTSIAVVIGVCSWMNISKIVRSEVRQIGESDYVLAARTFGGSFFYIVRRHLAPNFISSIMFMVVSNVGAAIGMEATLSFLGLGLPIETVSWGSLMSMSETALLSGNWWIIVIPGTFLITTIICLTDIGEYIRKSNNRIYSNL